MATVRSLSVSEPLRSSCAALMLAAPAPTARKVAMAMVVLISSFLRLPVKCFGAAATARGSDCSCAAWPLAKIAPTSERSATADTRRRFHSDIVRYLASRWDRSRGAYGHGPLRLSEISSGFRMDGARLGPKALQFKCGERVPVPFAPCNAG